MRGRPRIKQGEESVSVNVRLPESTFDEVYHRAKNIADAECREVSLAEAVRRMMPEPVDETIYGPPDDRPPLDSRHVDALLDTQKRWNDEAMAKAIGIAEDCSADLKKAIEVAKESLAASKELWSLLMVMALENASLWTAIDVASKAKPSECQRLLKRLKKPDSQFPY